MTDKPPVLLPRPKWFRAKTFDPNDDVFGYAETKAHMDTQDARIAELKAERDTPETEDFFKGVPLEAAHQRERWGAEHDSGKTPADWF